MRDTHRDDAAPRQQLSQRHINVGTPTANNDGKSPTKISLDPTDPTVTVATFNAHTLTNSTDAL